MCKTTNSTEEHNCLPKNTLIHKDYNILHLLKKKKKEPPGPSPAFCPYLAATPLRSSFSPAEDLNCCLIDQMNRRGSFHHLFTDVADPNFEKNRTLLCVGFLRNE